MCSGDFGMSLKLSNLPVPNLVELLKLLHVSLLHAKPLSKLLRTQFFASAILFMLSELLEACPSKLGFVVFALSLTIEAVLFQHLEKVLYSMLIWVNIHHAFNSTVDCHSFAKFSHVSGESRKNYM